MRKFVLISAFGLLVSGVGCAQNRSVDAKDRPDHYAVRTKRLGSNIPQPYAAGADSNTNPDTDQNLREAQQLSNSSGSMKGAGGGTGR